MLFTTGPARRVRPTLAIAGVMLLGLTACAHSDPATEADGASTTVPTDSTAPVVAEAGDFGTLEGICGPGEPGATTARGVTDTTIQIGVLNDATSTIAPGLGAIYVDVAHAFAEWCNEAGGINGRTIEIVSRDAQITQAAARVVDACQGDFMLVGGATPLDATTVEPRVACDLGSIPAYSASPEATSSALQALPTRAPTTEVNMAAVRLLDGKYHDEFQKIGIVAVDNPSLLGPAELVREAVPLAGGQVVSFQKLPLQVDNARAYVQPLVGTVEALFPPPSVADLFLAMKDVGYSPEVVVDPVGNTYNQSLIDALGDSALDVPYYIAQSIVPLELADENPATELAIELAEASGTDQAVDAGIIPSFAAWVLFASSATACGDDLTVDCVIEQATSQTDFTAGGLTAPVDLSDPNAIGACRLLISATSKGFTYEERLTQPTDGLFNCDPANIVTVEG